MLFDFEKFSNITASVYPGGAYSLEGALSVFSTTSKSTRNIPAGRTRQLKQVRSCVSARICPISTGSAAVVSTRT